MCQDCSVGSQKHGPRAALPLPPLSGSMRALHLHSMSRFAGVPPAWLPSLLARALQLRSLGLQCSNPHGVFLAALARLMYLRLSGRPRWAEHSGSLPEARRPEGTRAKDAGPLHFTEAATVLRCLRSLCVHQELQPDDVSVLQRFMCGWCASATPTTFDVHQDTWS